MMMMVWCGEKKRNGLFDSPLLIVPFFTMTMAPADISGNCENCDLCAMAKNSCPHTDLTFINILDPDGGSYILGATRMAAFLVLVFLNKRNMNLVSQKAENSAYYIRGLILPSYSEYIYLLLAINFLSGATDLIISQNVSSQAAQVNNWVVPIEMAIFHCLNEGLAIFLTRFGAGRASFHRALVVGIIWGFITAVIFFCVDALQSGLYGFPTMLKVAVAIFLGFELLLFFFYFFFLVTSETFFYRRPAMMYFAKFNVLYQLFWIIAAILLILGESWSDCSSAVIGVILEALLKPYVIFKTLQMDSQYWQGQGNDTPFEDQVWDNVDIDTAACMASNLSKVEISSGRRNTLPILHFGLIDMEKRLGYVAGGFSRVYFGKLRGKKVALKMMFAMELTPKDVEDFYREGKVIFSLQHANVVICHGVCVMPPALTLVLEYCTYGSLFDFLHKAREFELGSMSRDGPDAEEERKSGDERRSERATRSSWDAMSVFRQTDFFGGRPSISRARLGSFRPSVRGPGALSPSSNSSEWGFTPSNSISSPLWNDEELGLKSDVMTLRRSLIDGNQEKQSQSQSAAPTSTRGSDASSSLSIPTIGARLEVESEDDGMRPSDTGTIGSAASQNRPSLLSSALAMFRGSDISGIQSWSNRETGAAPIAHHLPPQKRALMMGDAARAVAFLHSKGYMHCDIKSLNFLVAEDFCVKLADFGETRTVGSDPRYDCPAIQARQWAPPEVLAPNAKADAYSIESDVFSLSIVLSEIINLKIPYDEGVERITPSAWHDRLTTQNERPTLPTSLAQPIRDVICRAWSTEKARRCSAEELLRVIEAHNAADA